MANETNATEASAHVPLTTEEREAIRVDAADGATGRENAIAAYVCRECVPRLVADLDAKDAEIARLADLLDHWEKRALFYEQFYPKDISPNTLPSIGDDPGPGAEREAAIGTDEAIAEYLRDKEG